MEKPLDIVKFRRQLDQRLLELDEMEQQGSRRSNVELDQNKVGRLSRLDALQQQAILDEILHRAKSERAKIQKALQRIARGDFGLCRECDEAIDERRLDFDPTLDLCINCANLELQ
jgi:DnaK suppressor protein